jgi:predicted transcriptional regulator
MTRQRRVTTTLTLADIRAAVARGYADVEAGRVIDGEEAFAELEAYFRATGADDAHPGNPMSGDG